MRDFARSGKLTFFSRRRNILAFEKLVPEGSDLATEYPRTFTWHKKLIALPYVSLTDIWILETSFYHLFITPIVFRVDRS